MLCKWKILGPVPLKGTRVEGDFKDRNQTHERVADSLSMGLWPDSVCGEGTHSSAMNQVLGMQKDLVKRFASGR